ESAALPIELTTRAALVAYSIVDCRFAFYFASADRRLPRLAKGRRHKANVLLVFVFFKFDVSIFYQQTVADGESTTGLCAADVTLDEMVVHVLPWARPVKETNECQFG